MWVGRGGWHRGRDAVEVNEGEAERRVDADGGGTVDFQEFLRRVKAALINPSKRAWLLFDQARAHTAKTSMKMIEENWHPLKQPYASCQNNAVERLFSVLKRRFR